MRKLFKKALAIASVAMLMTCMIACGKKDVDAGLTVDNTVGTVDGASKQEEVKSTDTPQPTATPEPTPTPTPIPAKEKLIKAIEDTVLVGSSTSRLVGGTDWFRSYMDSNKGTIVLDFITTDMEQMGGTSLGANLVFAKDKVNDVNTLGLNITQNGAKAVTFNVNTEHGILRVALPQLFDGCIVIDGNTLETDLKSDSYLATQIRASIEDTKGSNSLEEIDIDKLKEAITNIDNLDSVLELKRMYDNLIDTSEVTEEKVDSGTMYTVVFTDDAMVDFGTSAMNALMNVITEVLGSLGTVGEEDFDIEEINKDIEDMVANIEKLDIKVIVAESGLVSGASFIMDVADSENMVELDVKLGSGEKPLDNVNMVYKLVTEETEYSYDYSNETNEYITLTKDCVVTETTEINTQCGENSQQSSYFESYVKTTEERKYTDDTTETEVTSDISVIGSVESSSPGQVYTISARVKDNSDYELVPTFEYLMSVNLTDVARVELGSMEYKLLELTEEKFSGLMMEIMMNMQKDPLLSLMLSGSSEYEEDIYNVE